VSARAASRSKDTYLGERYRPQARRSGDKKRIRQLERLGHKVTLQQLPEVA
jgi:hypothetical protein